MLDGAFRSVCPETEAHIPETMAITRINEVLVPAMVVLAYHSDAKSPARAGPSSLSLVASPCLYRKFVISASSADFGGRVTDSGRVDSGSATMFSRSMNVGFCVSM